MGATLETCSEMKYYHKMARSKIVQKLTYEVTRSKLKISWKYLIEKKCRETKIEYWHDALTWSDNMFHKVKT